jgi:hypothetical protein
MGIREREGGREGYESRGKYVGGEVGGRIEKGRMRIEIGVKEYGGNKQGVEGMFRLGYAI